MKQYSEGMHHSETMASGRSRERRAREREFRMMVLVCIAILLPIIVVSRLLPRAWRTADDEHASRQSVLAEARETAHTIIPYAFMG